MLWNVREYLDQSGLMFAVRTTLAHFSVSSTMNLPKSAGEPGNAAAPRSVNRAFSLGIGEAGIDLPVEFLDDLGGRVSRRADASPGARLVTRHELAHRWNVRQHFRTRCRGYCQRAQLAVFDVLDRLVMEPNMTCTCPPSRSISAAAPPR